MSSLPFTFKFAYLAAAFIQSNLQTRQNTPEQLRVKDVAPGSNYGSLAVLEFEVTTF